MSLVIDERVDGAWMCGAGKRCAGAKALAARRPLKWRTFRGQRASNTASGKFSGELCESRRKIAITSRWAAICGRKPSTIRKKIIGRNMRALRRSLAGGSGLQRLRRVPTLLHEPARQHGRGILLEPLVEKRANLLAEIGGMAEAREFIALQRSAGS